MKAHRKMSKRAKKKLAVVAFDIVMKFTGVAMFMIGLGGMAEIPTDPKSIVRALSLFISGICIIAWNGYLIDRKGDKR